VKKKKKKRLPHAKAQRREGKKKKKRPFLPGSLPFLFSSSSFSSLCAFA